MPPGTIYMYYARGGDSFNISAKGLGNAVLIKSAFPYLQGKDATKSLTLMQTLNPPKNGEGIRTKHKLCNGQTLLCRTLDTKVPDWDKKHFDRASFYIASDIVI